MSRKLHSKPSLHQLKRQAKELQTACRNGDPEVCAWVKKLLPRLKNASQAEVWAGEVSLSEAQLVIARRYGFDSWPKLKKYVESISSDFDAKVFHFSKRCFAGCECKIIAPATSIRQRRRWSMTRKPPKPIFLRLS